MQHLEIENGGGAKQIVPPGNNLLTKSHVASMCQVTLRTVDRWMQCGALVYYKIGRTVRFRLTDLQEHWNARCRVARGRSDHTGEA